MRLYRKEKKDFILIEDTSSIKIGNIVKVFSEKTNKFVSKAPYFVHRIDGSRIYLEQGTHIVCFDALAGSFALK